MRGDAPPAATLVDPEDALAHAYARDEDVCRSEGGGGGGGWFSWAKERVIEAASEVGRAAGKVNGFFATLGGFDSDFESSDEGTNDRNNVYFGNPLIYVKESDMYIDSDGTIAHEFWEEGIDVHSGKGNGMLVKVPVERLMKQKVCKLDIPRLKPDFPIVLCTTESLGNRS
eukprot:Nk52_evm5s675 gene=Nk52_evmTU5s675